MEEDLCYLISIRWSQTSHFLLWKDFNDRPAEFLLDKNGYVCMSTTEAEIIELSSSLGENLERNSLLYIDFDKLWILLTCTKIKPSISRLECNLIINAWNIIEDLSRTLCLPPLRSSKKNKKHIQCLYDKVFVGVDVLDCNIDTNKSHSLLYRKDRVFIFKYLYTTWLMIKKDKRFFSNMAICEK